VPDNVLFAGDRDGRMRAHRLAEELARQPTDPDYADVVSMFRRLQTLNAESPEFGRVRDCIVRRCLPLADHIARRFDGKGEPREDLVQVARVGLVNAVDRFDVDAGSHFLSFAVPTMMGEVRRHFRDNGWWVRAPRPLQELHLRINAATPELTQQLGRSPSAGELAEELGVDREQVMQGLTVGTSYSAVSIDAASERDDGTSSLVSRLGADDPNLDHITDRETLRPILQHLPARYRQVLVLRFFESLPQTQIGERMGVSQMQVSRLLAQALNRVRDRLQMPGTTGVPSQRQHAYPA
jgi:RNA polymerase sigma-B factor